MAVVINGSGTVTGLAVGGLPDGIVDSGTLATNSVDSAELIDGAVDNSHIDAMAASKLTGALPAISGANLTGLVSSLSSMSDATVSASSPTITTNPSAVGYYWINSTSGEAYIATDVTTDNNVWTNIAGGSDVQPYTFDPSSPYDYGDGSDGNVTSVTVTDTYLTNSPSSGTSSCTVNSSTGFSSGDQVLIIQTQKSSLTTGTFEMIAISGISTNTITFATTLQNSYSSGSSAVTTQMVRIPQYQSVTLSSTFNVPAWDGNEGGIFICKCLGTFALSAQINATGKGFRGGTAASVGYGNGSAQGEGQQDNSSNDTERNASGGGGGRMNSPGSLSAKSGAGGAHAAAGTNGDSNAYGGASWGEQDLTSHLGFGGGGGAGGYDYSTAGASGSNGGGIIIIMADTLTLSGSGELSASGIGGVTGAGAGDGGGGAGGSIYIKSGDFNSNSNCNASAGAGSEDGGAGSAGRIHVQGTLTGSTNPTAYTG